MSRFSQSIEDDIRAAESGWINSCCRCQICGKTWCAVWPIDLDRFDADDEKSLETALNEQIPELECPRCGQQGSTQAIEPHELNPTS